MVGFQALAMFRTTAGLLWVVNCVDSRIGCQLLEFEQNVLIACIAESGLAVLPAFAELCFAVCLQDQHSDLLREPLSVLIPCGGFIACFLSLSMCPESQHMSLFAPAISATLAWIL